MPRDPGLVAWSQRIFQQGLHEFLTALIDDTAVLGDGIENFYMA
jgi:hypothetical protein